MPDFVSGTQTIFKQSSAPTGWTKVTTYNDFALRVVNGTASDGGTLGFSVVHQNITWSGTVGGVTTTDNFTLTTNEIPTHNHGTYTRANQARRSTPGVPRIWGTPGTNTSSTTGGGGAHAHPVQVDFQGGNSNLSINYCDVIISSKD